MRQDWAAQREKEGKNEKEVFERFFPGTGVQSYIRTGWGLKCQWQFQTVISYFSLFFLT